MSFNFYILKQFDICESHSGKLQLVKLIADSSVTSTPISLAVAQ